MTARQFSLECKCVILHLLKQLMLLSFLGGQFMFTPQFLCHRKKCIHDALKIDWQPIQWLTWDAFEPQIHLSRQTVGIFWKTKDRFIILKKFTSSNDWMLTALSHAHNTFQHVNTGSQWVLLPLLSCKEVMTPCSHHFRILWLKLGGCGCQV